MCFIDLEPCTVWNEVQRRARKPHRCVCCSGMIAPGQLYIAHFSKFEGSITSEKLCLPCRDDRATFAAEHDGTLPSPGWFREMLQECIGEHETGETDWQPMMDRIEARESASEHGGSA